jgi:hypothetical protein
MNRVKTIIEELGKEYNHVPEIFGGAIFACENIRVHGFDMDDFVGGWLDRVVQNADRYNWHEGVSGALERFCHICLVDPRIVEAYIGVKFKELDNV